MSMRTKNRFLSMTCPVMIAAAGYAAAQEKPAGKAGPNVVILLADDLGYADTGFTGAKDIPTPHLNALAARGIFCTQAYVTASMCSPSRAGLMSGRYQQRWGHDSNWSTTLLPVSEKNLAERMKVLGYTTGIFGKWHLGRFSMDLPKDDELDYVRGFDEVFITCHNAQYFKESFLDSKGSKRFEPIADPSIYTTDICAERSVDFIHRNKDRPFFLYVPLNAVHEDFYAPLKLEAPQKYLDRVAGITNVTRQLMAATVIGMDETLGSIVRALRENGLEQNTLIVFLNDNGGSLLFPEGTAFNTPFRGGKGNLLEGGIRTPFVLCWPGRVPGGMIYNHPVSSLDVMPTVIAAAGGDILPAWGLDGVNLLPWFEGKMNAVPHDALFWRTGDEGAVRAGDWKLLISPDGRRQLYDLGNDVSESNDLSGKLPDKVKELERRWANWSAAMGKPQPTVPPEGFTAPWLKQTLKQTPK